MLNGFAHYLTKFNYKYIKPWFFSSDDPYRIKAPYVISTIFLFLTGVSIIIHLVIKVWQFVQIVDIWCEDGLKALEAIERIAKMEISLVPLITVLVGAAGIFIGLYNMGKTRSNIPAEAPTFSGTGKDDGSIGKNEI